MMQEAQRYKDDWQAAQRLRVKSGSANDSFVYVHLNADDDLPHHVGMGYEHERPWEMEKSRSSKHKNKTVKHGVRVELIADELTWENAQWWEVRWIKALKAVGYQLTNLNEGGTGNRGYHHTDETKKLIGEKSSNYLNSLGDDHPSKRPETREKISKSRDKYKGENHPMYGKEMPQETRDKISASLSGENHPNYGKPCEAMLAALREYNPRYWLGKKGPQHPAHGRKVSDTTKQLLREINTGKTHSDETKALISIKSSGENNGMFGRKHTVEVIEYNRQISLAQKTDPNYIAKYKAGIAAREASVAAVMRRIFLSWERSYRWNNKNLYWGA